MLEKWSDVEGYEGVYQVSNLGRVKSLPRLNKRGHKISGCILKETVNSRGYSYVVFQDNRSKVVHRLVAKAFVPNALEKPYVNHINGMKTDNRFSNLEWVSHAENITHAWESGLAKAHSGEKHHNAVLTNQEAEEIRILYKSKKHTHADLADLFGVSESTIQKVVSNKTYKNAGGTKYASL